MTLAVTASLMPRRHTVLALVVGVCWTVNFVVIDVRLESFPPLLFAPLRFGLIAFPAIFFVPRRDVRWLAVVAVGLFICVGQFRAAVRGDEHWATRRPRVGDRAASAGVHDPARHRRARSDRRRPRARRLPFRPSHSASRRQHLGVAGKS